MLAAVHPTILVMVGAAAIVMLFVAALLLLAVLGRALAMLAVILTLRRVMPGVILVLSRCGLSRGRSGDDERDRHGDDLHVGFLGFVN